MKLKKHVSLFVILCVALSMMAGMGTFSLAAGDGISVNLPYVKHWRKYNIR